jgi:hypothetical protein
MKKSIIVQQKTYQKKNIPWVAGGIKYEMASGTLIRGSSGELIDTMKIWLWSIDAAKKLKAKAKYEKKMKSRGNKRKGLAEATIEGFEFGLSGSHLIFSKPVMLEIDASHMSDGNVVDLMTMHAGDTDFHTGGLSLSANTLCSSDGSASIPGSEAIVKGGKVTFYTCGASLFTMNPTGGTAGSNDLRILIGDCAQAQIYYNNLQQIYNTNPPATGCGGPGSWAMLRIGWVTYGNNADGVTATAWSTQTTTGSTSGNTYTATSTMTRIVWALTYTLIIDWSHTAPNKYFTWSYRVIIPATNTLNVRFYMGNDTTVAGWDANDAGYFSSTGGTTVGIYDSVANVLSAFRYMSGAMWTGYEAWAWANITTRINGGTDFNNTISTTADQGFWVNWNFGITPGTYSGTVEWRVLPFVTANVPDLIPGIGQPEWSLTVGYLSQMPISWTNAGNLASSGVHTTVLTLPTNISWPTSPFTDNWWSCGVTVWVTVTCTKTTTIAPLAVDTFRIPVIPLPWVAATVTFNWSISNPGDSNVTNNTATSTNAVAIVTLVFAPGGVTGMTYWTKADGGKNCNTAGCTITSWSNSGTLGAAANAVTGLGTVTYDTTNLINYNPTLYFNNASLNTNSNLTITTAAASVFTMTKIGAWGSFLLGPQTATNNSLDWSTSPTLDRLGLYPATNIYNGANLRAANTPDITSTSRATGWSATSRTDGRQTLTNAANVTPFASATRGIGRSFNTNSTLANVGEVIIYPTEIIGTPRSKVESYLSIKYGITLDQTTAQNYILSNTGIAWNGTLAGIFNRDIAGIARDDVSSLAQAKSQSVNNTGDIIVNSVSAIGTNFQSLIWANDASATWAFVTTDSPTGYERITREWQFQEKNGDLGNVKVSYPTLSVPSGFTGTLMMLTDSDGVFATGITAYTGTLVGSSWEFTVNIADMQYITFAKVVPTDTTPPTILSNSVASGTLAPVGTFPITITYADTGSSIVPWSLSGKIYAWDATGATWDIIDIALPYLSVTSASTSTWVFALSGLPFGKYRFDLSIADSIGNTRTQSYTYYIDAIEWTVSAPTYAIGNAPLGSSTIGTWELILTVKTVGAGFDLSMLRTTDLTYLTDVIPVYSGSTGWWYDKNIWAGYSGSIIPHGTTQNIVSVVKNINTNGQKNTFTYRLKYAVNPSANTPAGDYVGDVRFGINLAY